MPKFQGEEDPDAYLSWVLKVDKIFRIHNFSEAKKVAMASLEFEGYANVWWEEVNKKREKEDLAPIDTWEEMQEVMHTRFVPTHHKRDLFNKLTQLKQSYKSVEEYYKEMHMTMMSANVDEREEQTMARFLNGLNIPVKRIVVAFGHLLTKTNKSPKWTHDSYVEHQDHGEDVTPWSREGEEQLSKKMYTELDPKSPEERKEEKTDGRSRTRSDRAPDRATRLRIRSTGRLTGPPGSQPGYQPVPSGQHPGASGPRPVGARSQARSGPDRPVTGPV
ncbi:hypothetical protein QYE76_018461 [Lolium multiflorum]|uniref:Retrotransposon gag domain-containing protein n=1 Tax=Lolium multiflorum TaxID=4521 RepID=A0AAD8UVQ3_LOLMU|nr:hypothetical protein QYE76_018461 [Lolium multiflorum]